MFRRHRLRAQSRPIHRTRLRSRPDLRSHHQARFRPLRHQLLPRYRGQHYGQHRCPDVQVDLRSRFRRRGPLDLSSFVIHSYKHDGDKIAGDEQKRFVNLLTDVVKEILPVKNQANDSPVYTFLHGMPILEYSVTDLVPPTYVRPEDRAAAKPNESESLAGMLRAAEAAKKEERYEEAIEILERAIGDQKKPDISLPQRLALVTYKAGEKKDERGEVDNDSAIAALIKAQEILETYCAPNISNDPETLGLSGAINKRLYDRTENTRYLDKAIGFYERGFYVKQDSYNGINVAFMHTMKANMEEDRFQAIVYYGHANLIRRRVVEICQEKIASDGFAKSSNDEKMWLYLTLAEAYQGIGGMQKDIEELMPRIRAVWNKFGQRTFEEQRQKLQKAIDAFRARIRPETLKQPTTKDAAETGEQNADMSKTSGPDDSPQPSLAEPGESLSNSTRALANSPGAIVVDANVGRKIKSVKVKIEYGS